jgi:hypothetical protein
MCLEVRILSSFRLILFDLFFVSLSLKKVASFYQLNSLLKFLEFVVVNGRKKTKTKNVIQGKFFYIILFIRLLMEVVLNLLKFKFRTMNDF